MWKRLLFPFMLFWPSFAFAQLTEDFEDGDFTNDPQWYGDTALWQVKNGRLNSNFILATGDPQVTYSLSTPSTHTKSTSWEFWIKTGPTSRNNLIRIFLSSQNKHPRYDKPDKGYFLEIGNTADKIALYKKDSLSHTLLIDGRSGITENAELKIKVVCDAEYHWHLFTDATASGLQYFSEGWVIDSSITTSNYFSIVIFQKGKSANRTHWLDDIFIQSFLPDTAAPVLENIYSRDNHRLHLYFSEMLSPDMTKDWHYHINDQNPDSVDFLPGIGSALSLHFKEPFQSQNTYQLYIDQLMDLFGNTQDTIATFTHFIPGRSDVIMSEIYPDPTPSHGLPEYEYIELYNTSTFPVSLQGWQFCDKNRCAVFPAVMLPPDSVLIVLDQDHESAFHSFGNTVGLYRFPTLNNDGDNLYLKNESGKIIDQVFYTKKSYKDKNKSKGGWSLQVQYPAYPCFLTGNWAASEADSGGSPGRIDKNMNQSAPSLEVEYLAVIDSLHLMVQCNVMLSEEALEKSIIAIDGAAIQEVKEDVSYPNRWHILLRNPLMKRKVYTLKVEKLESCGMTINKNTKVVFGIPEQPSENEILLNELLFNPKTRGAEFVEFYNASSKIIDLQTIFLANRRSGQVNQVFPSSMQPYYLLPDQYVAITADKSALLQQYICKYPKNIVEVDRVPSYPNISGSVLVLDDSEEVLDRFDYKESDQYAFFHQKKGVSLEKMNPVLPSTTLLNWESASSLSGYATPGYRNSQFVLQGRQNLQFACVPETFSPDGDGYEDQTFLRYSLSPGYSAKIQIYNEYGLLVRHLKNNVSLGTKGEIPWDGRDDKGQTLPTGIYIFYVGLYHPSGETHSYKLPVVLVKRR